MGSITKSQFVLIIGILIALLVGYTIGIGVGSYESDAEIRKLERQIRDLEQKNSKLNETMEDDLELSHLGESNFDDIVDSISEIYVTQHYEWNYGGYSWWVDQPIYLPSYLYYYNLERPPYEEWDTMCLDSNDDILIENLVDLLLDISEDEGLSEYEQVMFVISFVHHLPYTEDVVTKSRNEYPRYPTETLFDRGGDCEDTSILVATLLNEMGYDVALLELYNENHIAVGVAGGVGIYGSYYEVDGVNYFYLETTGEGFDLGEIPDDFPDSSANIYPLNDAQ